ncbi:unnamed protein product [Symbiodinium pilosum]|uniref:Palmitoyltransferase n=1 Tax=Symbiodinium pilosum TaxID=2952 RepID=A0A812MAR3_SYMPI|nr:unnamed protein product [Symbiodinium pilosum]
MEPPRLRQRQDCCEKPGQVQDANDEAEKEGRKERPVSGDGMHHPCCRSFLASPFWKCTTLVVVGFTPVFGMCLAMPELLAALEIPPWSLMWTSNFLFGSWISVQFLFNFIATQWTDPGGCKSIKPPHEVTGQFALGRAADAPQLLYAPNWCQKCAHWKPPRSHHCSMCKRCVLRMDHHCPFTGNCIGMRNHGHFILFYIFSFLGVSYSLVLCLAAVWTASYFSRFTTAAGAKLYENQRWISQQTHIVSGLNSMLLSVLLEVLHRNGITILVQLGASIMAMVAVAATGTPALHLAWTNTTTMEKLFPMKEYVQLKEQVYCPIGPGFYRQSGRENLKVILGDRWWLRLLFPVRGSVDQGEALAPRPSKEGCLSCSLRIVRAIRTPLTIGTRRGRSPL